MILQRLPLLSAAAAVAALTLTACGGATEAASPASSETGASSVSVTHAQGTTEVPVNPETVYSFDLGVLDTLDALDVDVDGVPQANLPESLSRYKDAANIGTLKEPDFEAVSEGAPDLIIISGRTAGAYEELSKIAPTIDLSVAAADPMASFTEVTNTLGEIFDKQDEATERLAALNDKIEATRSAAAGAGNGLVLMTSGGELTAYGAGSRFGLIHDVLGVKTAADVKAEGTHGEAVSFEYVATTNPANLFVIDRDVAVGEAGEAASAVLDNELVQGTDAAKKGNIVFLDSNRWYVIGYGLNNLDAMIGEVQDGLA